jgi:predicted nucleic acid-binding protein
LRLYLDVSCLNRPFDDQSQARIRLETEAISVILERVDSGQWTQVSSEVALLEIDAIADGDRRARVRLLLPEEKDILKLTAATFQRAAALQRLGFKPADALHVAAAEEAGADVLLSCDDRLCRRARRHRQKLRVQVANPLDWLREMGDAANP